MIVNLHKDPFSTPWDKFRDKIWETLGNEGSDKDFWKMAYQWSRVIDVPNTDSLVEFETEQDVAIFLLTWS